MNIQPPKNALNFLRWFCHEDFIDEIEGDLIELFEKEFEQSPRRAKWNFIWQVLRHLRPDFIRSFGLNNLLIHHDMFRHNLLITYRGFLRDKTSFLINLIGLSSALICVLLIFLWVNDELSMDKFHENESQLYQVMQHFETGGEIFTWDYSSLMMPDAMLEELPEVEAATSTNNRFYVPKGLIAADGENYITTEGIYARENFFDIFSFELLVGEKEDVLSDKKNIVLSEEVALALFQSKDKAIGQTVRWTTEIMDTSFMVSGVFENVGSNSTMKFNAIVHTDNLIDADEHAGNWNGDYAKTFITLKEGTDINAFNKKIANFYEGRSDHRDRFTLFAQKYSDRYLNGNYADGKLIGGRIEYVKLFSIIALFILLIACVNFMNLSTAQASKKMKEVGVKKTIGATRGALITQFFSSSILMTLFSFLIAIIAVSFILPFFNQLTNKELQLSLSSEFIFAILATLFLTGLLSGSYPALYLSKFNPVKVLKGVRVTSVSEQWIRKGLVVFQFALSTIFIVGVLVVHNQMKYIQTKNLGYNRDNILTFERPIYDDKIETFLNEIKKIKGVETASNMAWGILDGVDNQGGFQWSGDESERKILFQSPRIGYDVIETLGMEVIMGRSFSREHKDNHEKIVINESALELMDLENPIGKSIRYGRDRYSEIIGVVKDFQYGSIHKPIEPMILRFRNHEINIMVKLESGNEMVAIDGVEKVFKEFHPEYPFEFSFMDEEYQALYEAENRVASLSKIFSVLAIIISCLGLFGLAAFTAERRSKEIGVRKILGASVWSTVKLLSQEFTKLVAIGILIAIPAGYFFSNNWLNNFAYKIELQWWFFGLAALTTLIIAWSTVGYQTFKAAQVNPVQSLKNE